MIIGLLDPALFSLIEPQKVPQRINLIIQICRIHHIKLTPISEYWDKLWSDLAKPLEKRLHPKDKRALQALRQLSDNSNVQLPHLEIQAGKVWRRGFEQLFGTKFFSNSWEEPMMRAVLRALNAQHDVIILTQNIPKRNLCQYTSKNCTLDKITRWVLHVQPKGMGHRQILCVHHLRNLQEKWTCRFDWRLPTVSDGAKYPFCPPERWWLVDTKAYGTVESKPAWLDVFDNGWARPNIPDGAGHHWDVFIKSNQLQKKVGLNQINVAAFDISQDEGLPGTIHHTPRKKQGKLTGTGWKCD